MIGPNADVAKLGGGGSSEVSPSRTVSPVEGLDARAAGVAFERGIAPIRETTVFDGRDGVGDADARLDDAVDAAAAADCAVVVVQDDASEAADRPDMELPGRQDDLVAAVAAEAARTVVVLRTSGSVAMPWLASVDAVVQSWYPGQADGDALATVLYGDADPGGRLPVTFGRTADQYPTAAPTAYPGTDGRARYGEGIFVGYRYFDDRAAEPLFPFGYGQSYATFEYADPRLDRVADGVRVTVRVRNTGDRRGRDVLQAYVGKTAAPVPTPPRELAGFERVSLGPGETTTLGVTVPDSAFDYYDGGWTRSRGRNRVVVGRSSRDRIGTFDVDV